MGACLKLQATLMFPVPQAGPMDLPAARDWDGSLGQTTEVLGPLERSPRWKDVRHSYGGSKVWSSSPHPGRGREVSRGSLGGGGSKQPPLHLAAGSWDTGQEGHLSPPSSASSLEQAGLGWEMGRGDSCLARSFQAKMGMRDHWGGGKLGRSFF